MFLLNGLALLLLSLVFLYTVLTTFTRKISVKETALIESEKKYMMLFESNPIPMWVYDMQTLDFLLVNNAAIETYGYSREEFLSMKLFDIRPSSDHVGLMESVKNDNNQYSFSSNWKHMKKNNEIIIVEIYSHPITFENRKAKLVLASNITQRVKTEEEIKAVVGELNNFVYRASHDLRGPLARMIGLSNLVLIESKEQHLHQYHLLIHHTALLLDNILQRLLSINRLKEYVPEIELVDVHLLVDEIIAMVRQTNMDALISFRNELPGDLVIKSDKKILLLTLENLIENSVKYADTSIGKVPYLRINAAINKGFLNIFINDNGIGIKKEIKDKIFDLFYRGTERSHGSGLGLFIARTAAKIIHGNVIFHSEIREETVFELQIPLLK